MPIDFKQLQEFIEAIATTDITELTIKEGDFELTVNKSKPEVATPNYTISPPPVAVTPTVENNTPEAIAPSQNIEKPAEENNKKRDNWKEITSPMVGTFYRASAPGESPFVEEGDKISVGSVVCIIEAMKLMNEIESEITGQVMEIAVENGEPVEYGQTLLWVAT
ncbi:acetyl-CoA carboxylase biotin carboxyl carrier protein [Cyanobacterium stanieri LEGE 03274]|uniref:Biotin carboxyl carrier protein of acetyl-CoA carboxylase n=1 Tax=Cyanobacterium stanieri LEGE 03274 TaxID=1828756 RepID=A0ABR9V6U6_9CHRO|nr:acetyl-CoA carboxylase biotin carboxyl carrier protein [Cyanobacterium stanieri LEGE 03274]